MKIFYQTEKYPIGDCFRTCVASILEVENLQDVPNFMKDGEDSFNKHFNKWLRKNNMLYITYQIHNSAIDGFYFDEWKCILTGIDKFTRIGHSVVGEAKYNKNSNMIEYFVIHNPSKDINIDNLELINCGFLSKRIA